VVNAFVLAEISPNFAPGPFQDFVALYRNTFHDPRECEDPASWPPRMTDPPQPGQPRTRILGAFSQTTLAGGLVHEEYQGSRCALLTYLAVAPPFRRTGLGSRLIREALDRLAQLPGGGTRAVFSEVENPDLMPQGTDEDPTPRDRLAFFARLEARRVAVGYVQPDLGGAAGRARHLLLLCYASALPEGILRRDVLVDFLHEFYRALGTDSPDSDPDFRAMTVGLPDPVPLESLPVPLS